MPPITLLDASKIPGAPSFAELVNLSNAKTPYTFFIKTGSSVRIDTDSKSWLSFMGKRERSQEAHNEEKANAQEMQAILDESTQATLLMPVYKKQRLQLQVMQQKLEYKRASGKLIEYALCNYLFISFMEVTNTEILLLLKKLSTQIRDLVKENKPDDVMRLIQNEVETILKDIKAKQKKAISDWRDSLKDA